MHERRKVADARLHLYEPQLSKCTVCARHPVSARQAPVGTLGRGAPTVEGEVETILAI